MANAVTADGAGGVYRVNRGGGWPDLSKGCRYAYRNSYDPGLTRDNFGFRVVLAPILVP